MAVAAPMPDDPPVTMATLPKSVSTSDEVILRDPRRLRVRALAIRAIHRQQRFVLIVVGTAPGTCALQQAAPRTGVDDGAKRLGEDVADAAFLLAAVLRARVAAVRR